LIEQGKRIPSTQIIQKIAEPLGFDLYGLLIMTGYLSPDSSLYSEEQREKLRTELYMLLERVASDTKRIKEIVVQPVSQTIKIYPEQRTFHFHILCILLALSPYLQGNYL